MEKEEFIRICKIMMLIDMSAGAIMEVGSVPADMLRSLLVRHTDQSTANSIINALTSSGVIVEHNNQFVWMGPSCMDSERPS